jgi:hypothetical protein
MQEREGNERRHLVQRLPWSSHGAVDNAVGGGWGEDLVSLRGGEANTEGMLCTLLDLGPLTRRRGGREGGGRKSGGNFTLGEKDGEGGLHSLIIKRTRRLADDDET